MLSHRAAGLLLHPTSLPGPLGMGDFGVEAYAFVDYLAAAKLTRWQILPLGPTGYGDSPYASFSTFAGNHLLISLERLAHEGHLEGGELHPPAEFSAERVNYGPVIDWKLPRLRRAADHFLQHAGEQRHQAFHEFCQREAARGARALAARPRPHGGDSPGVAILVLRAVARREALRQ
jgi:4-alpha-glucanotransferase